MTDKIIYISYVDLENTSGYNHKILNHPSWRLEKNERNNRRYIKRVKR